MAAQNGIIKRGNAYFADPTSIGRRAGFNPRIDFGEVAELAKSIQANGLLQPLRVRGVLPTDEQPEGKFYVLVDGDRRLTAVELLMEQGEQFADGVPVIIVPKTQDDVTALVQMFEANTGKPFTPVEEATAFQRMRDAGMSVKDIAARCGRSECHISDTLSLINATDELKSSIQKIGSVKAKAIAVAAGGDAETEKQLTLQAIEAVTASKAGDKTAQPKLKKALQAARQQRNEKKGWKGKAQKATALTKAELDKLAKSIAEAVTRNLAAANTNTAAEFLEAIKTDDKLALAYMIGVQAGLDNARGEQSFPLEV